MDEQNIGQGVECSIGLLSGEKSFALLMSRSDCDGIVLIKTDRNLDSQEGAMKRVDPQQPKDRTEGMKVMEHQMPVNQLNLSFTGRIARWSARHKWWVLAASVLALVMAMFVSGTVETKLLDGNEFAEGESGEAIRLLEERVDDGGAPTEQLVFSHPSLDVSDQVYRSMVEELVQELRALPEVSAVVSVDRQR